MRQLREEFWRQKTVLVTGHTGFKGSWISLWLSKLGAHVVGLALEPNTNPNLWSTVQDTDIQSFIGDIRDMDMVQNLVARIKPNIVLHLAAQSLVRFSYKNPLLTYTTNVMGTANLLEACRAVASLEAVLVVTSDKVYENRGNGVHFTESDRLGGSDPYSNSKACAELVTQSYRDSFFNRRVMIATARAGNVIGGGDWSEDRLIPDCIRAIRQGVPVALRNPEAVRPWQHVLEPLSGYLRFVRALIENPAGSPLALNFGPPKEAIRTVREIVTKFSDQMGDKPGWTADQTIQPVEAKTLALDSKLAEDTIGWKPLIGIDDMLRWTTEWYQASSDGADMLDFTLKQINEYEALLGGIP